MILNEMAELRMLQMEMVQTVRRWLRERDGNDLPRLNFKHVDQVRLIRLKTWEWRYKISVMEILDLIIPILRGTLRPHLRGKVKGGGYALGVKVTSVVGDGAEKILREQLRRLSSEEQRKAIWRQDEKQRQLDAEESDELEGVASKQKDNLSLLKVVNIKAYVTQYKRSITRQREQYDSAMSARWRKRKAYRNNPWR